MQLYKFINSSKLTILTLAAAGSLLSARATVVFENEGTLSGWSYTSHDGSGSVTEVSSPVYRGSTALKCYQTWSGSGDYTLHSEAVKRDVGQNGWNRYYGFAFYLPGNWNFSSSRGQSLCQLAADTACGGQQTEMFQLVGSRLEVKRELVDPCNPTKRTTTVTSSVTAGTWHRLVIHKKWAADNTGIFEVWFDGVRMINEVNTPNSFVGSELYRWSIGLYANFEVAGSRTLYIDHARVASSYSEADPANWNGPGVTFYSSVNYSGTASQVLAKGTYTLSQLAALGVANDSASSVRIPSGWTVTIYQNDNFGGTSWVLTSDTSSFTGISGLNDAMSSCIIE